MDAESIVELFAAFGPVGVRRMFGGFGIYLDGVMFALAADGVIYLKADDATTAAFRREGAGPFTYAAKGAKRVAMSYWRLPDRLYDDPDELAVWARDALAAARRAASSGRRARRSARARSARDVRRPASRPRA
jgi:DNA transformation protein and related proteins